MTFDVTDDNFSPAKPVDDATVRIPQVGYSSLTFENGEASTRVPVNQEYTVEVSKDGYQTVTQRFSVQEEPRDVALTISRTDDLNVRSANQRVVVGESTRITVTDEYGDPVSNAAVSVDGQSVGQTNSNGELDVPIHAAGEVTITVSDSGQSASVTVEGIEPSADDPTTPATPTPTPADETETADDTEASDSAGDSGPGFGVTTVLAALAGALVLARRR